MSTKWRVQTLSMDIEGKRQLCGSLPKSTVFGENEGKFRREEGETTPH